MELIDPAQPVDINITGVTDHVVAYGLWSRRPDEAEFSDLGEGHTGDNLPDHCEFTGPRKSQVYFWLGIGNPKRPNSAYQAVITFGQGGKRLKGGTIVVEGKTNAKGNDALEDWANLL